MLTINCSNLYKVVFKIHEDHRSQCNQKSTFLTYRNCYYNACTGKHLGQTNLVTLYLSSTINLCTNSTGMFGASNYHN